jgi:hypothetical protein
MAVLSGFWSVGVNVLDSHSAHHLRHLTVAKFNTNYCLFSSKQNICQRKIAVADVMHLSPFGILYRRDEAVQGIPRLVLVCFLQVAWWGIEEV